MLCCWIRLGVDWTALRPRGVVADKAVHLSLLQPEEILGGRFPFPLPFPSDRRCERMFQ